MALIFKNSVGCVQGTKRAICTEARWARQMLTASSFAQVLRASVNLILSTSKKCGLLPGIV